jgi:acyl carrier protein
MATPSTLQRGELQTWLLSRVAFHLDRPAGSVDPSADLARYGMDSVYAITIISDIEDYLQVEVDLEEARRRGTVDALTDYLVALTNR